MAYKLAKLFIALIVSKEMQIKMAMNMYFQF